MKKNVFTFALAMLTTSSIWGLKFSNEGLIYYVTDENHMEVEVSGYETETSNITIPDTIKYNGKKYLVTSIGNFAFSYNSKLQYITISKNVKRIGNSAFVQCNALTTITLPDSVTDIENSAFYSCSALRHVNIGSNVKNIEGSAFSYCSALTNIVLPNSIINIGNSAFKGCSKLTNINIPNSVVNIGSQAFSKCSSLTQITIPSSVKSIGSQAFHKCTTMSAIYVEKENNFYYSKEGVLFDKHKTELIQYPTGKQESIYHIPDGITKIKEYAFSDCHMLTQINIPNSVKAIEIGAFDSTALYNDINNWTDNVLYIDNCLIKANKELNGNYEIKANTRLIANNAFSLCNALTNVAIPKSITYIGAGAFNGTALYNDTINWTNNALYIDGCLIKVLQNINNKYEIKTNTRIIADDAFFNCSKLTQIEIPNSVTHIGNSAFSFCTTLTQAKIGNGVTEIGKQAFYRCSGLYQLTIGNNIKNIGDEAFSICYSLSEITILAIIPPIAEEKTFYYVNPETPVYIPAEALAVYKNDTYWKEFNLQAMQTGLQTPSMPESIRMEGGMLHNPQGLPVSIYDMQGRMVYSGTATTISQPAGVYVLHCAGASRKVLF